VRENFELRLERRVIEKPRLCGCRQDKKSVIVLTGSNEPCYSVERSSQAEVNVPTELTIRQKIRRSFLVVRRGSTSQWSTDGQSQKEIKYVRHRPTAASRQNKTP